MSDWPLPAELFNPLTAPPTQPLTTSELLASPFGLFVFLPLVPLVRIIGRRHRHAAIIFPSLAWLWLTLGPVAPLILLAGLAAGVVLVMGLGALRRRGALGPAAMITLVCVGLHILILPAWWFSSASWYGWRPTRLPVLHNIGFAYFLLRFIAWGVSVARQPAQPLRLCDTLCWILYPPCMRLGPLLRRETFLERFAAWEPAAGPDWRTVARRLGLFVVGVLGVAVTVALTPRVPVGGPDFFAAPQAYTTRDLMACFYLIPVQVYLLLWTYNELAAGLAAWIGIPVDDNFRWLPTATSVRDFWHRWNITVGAWLRDYIYIPLGGNRTPAGLAVVPTFAYVAVWHGASWSFLAWGLSQAAALLAQRQWDRLCEGRGWTNKLSGRWWTVVCWWLTMHYAVVTVLVFVDFDHWGTRFVPELVRRVLVTP